MDRWTVRIEFDGDDAPIQFTIAVPEWTPAADAWEMIKERCLEAEATVTICGANHLRPEEVLSGDQVSIRTSRDEVGAPIFYREVNLPFSEAVQDPAAHIRWRFGSISSKEPPPVVMDKMPLCGNCHSFSSDGALIGMDVDYGSDKGSYVICPVSRKMIYDNAKIITWSDYQREDNRGTLGLLSQMSPDGRYVISTVKDRSVFAAVDGLAFSQLFFPIQGILAYHDRRTKTFHALRGADDGRYVQSSPTWSPDGKYVVFARSKALRSEAFRKKRRGLSRAEDVAEFLDGGKTFKFDLWRVPFNDGKGGEPKPLLGASNNGMSNYFPKYSPDGKWIVFCRAKSFMLLQPDSALYIIPAEGGRARRLECNTSRMNSWHSWSPNGKWLVFSSKAYSPYTQLFLTHVDDRGRTTPPVVLSHFTSNDMAANIPEFVNAAPDAIRSIRQEFIDDLSYLQAGKWNCQDGEFDLAIRAFRKALEINPENTEARVAWGGALLAQGSLDEAREQFTEALSRDPANKVAYCLLGAVLEEQGTFPEAMETYRRALQVDPEYVLAHQSMGRLALKTGSTDEGRKYLLEAARLDPDNASPYIDLGNSFLREQRTDQAGVMYRQALGRDPDSDAAMIGLAIALIRDQGRRPRDIEEALELATKACKLTDYKSSQPLIVLADVYAAAGRLPEAVSVARKALDVAQQTGKPDLAATVRTLLEQYEQQMAPRRAP
ncbi:MAG TPA: tetratricopeptide repeat protein [Thermoguttaceae bacterium]|nr:tetratricopeptide repeat protein [Thermoguttaceae bacterium]